MTDSSAVRGNDVMQLIDAAVVLPKPEPKSIDHALGIVMTRVPGPPNWELAEGSFDGGPFEKAEGSYRKDLGSGALILRARRDPSLMEFDLDLDRFGPRPTPIPELSGPEGTSTYSYEFGGGTKTVDLSFAARSHRLQFVAIRWRPAGWKRSVQPGKEAIWNGAPAAIFLRNFDDVREVLEYALPKRTWVLRTVGDVPDADWTFGAFTREGDRVAGVFATPEGPAVFVDNSLMLARPGEASVRLEGAGSNRDRSTFSLLHHEWPNQTRVLNAIIYAHRQGVGANPYDTERVDVDLFALIASRLERAEFRSAYTQPWRHPKGAEEALVTTNSAGTEVRRCARCGEAALVCVRVQQVREILTATGWHDWRCQSCGASVRLYPESGIRRLRWIAVPMFFTVFLPIWYLIRAHKLSQAWRQSPIASGARYPIIRFPHRTEERRCRRCGGVVKPSEMSQQRTPAGSPLGVKSRYACTACNRTYEIESIGGNILNVVGGLLFGAGGLWGLLGRHTGTDALWGTVSIVIGVPLLWMAASTRFDVGRRAWGDPGRHRTDG